MIVKEEASAPARQAVREALDLCGLTDVNVSATYCRKSADQLPWLITIAGPAGLFLAQIMKAAGDDTWKGIKALVVRLHKATKCRRPTRNNFNSMTLAQAQTFSCMKIFPI